MERRLPSTRWLVPAVFALLLYTLIFARWGGISHGSEDPALAPTPVPPATPSVDMASARQVFDDGGELSYEEVVALRQEIVGPRDYLDIEDFDKSFEAQEKYWEREADFAMRLERCELKLTIGWVAERYKTYDDNHRPIPHRNRVGVYLYNPYYGFGKELESWPEMYLVNMSDKEVATLRAGQRIAFAGDLVMEGETEAVRNTRYILLEAEPPVAAPTAYELKDLHITLTRGMCNGTCPDYTLTVDAEGKVTFQGRHYTHQKGIATGMLERAQLVELATEIKKADFLGLDSLSNDFALDIPKLTLKVRMGGISNEAVTFTGRPRRLELLMARIDQVVNTEQWLGDEVEP